MSAVVDSDVLAITANQDPVVQAILLLLDTMQVPSGLENEYQLLRGQLSSPANGRLDVANYIGRLAGFNAMCQVAREVDSRKTRDAFNAIAALMGKMSQSVSATEMQAQSSFQGAQKTAGSMERQVHDIAYRLKISSNMEGMKVWMEQRLAILQARLDDYEALTSQQQSSLTTQLQKFSKEVEAVNTCLASLDQKSNPVSGAVYEDDLTGLDNRIGYEAAVQALLERTRQNPGRQAAMCVCDIDRLSDINLRHGEGIGDRVVKAVARKLRGVIGSENYLARLGGDQFGVLMLGTDIESAHLMSDKMCESIEAMQIEQGEVVIRVTISCGYTEVRKSDSSPDIWSRSDEGLREAKRAGGNCCWYREP